MNCKERVIALLDSGNIQRYLYKHGHASLVQIWTSLCKDMSYQTFRSYFSKYYYKYHGNDIFYDRDLKRWKLSKSAIMNIESEIDIKEHENKKENDMNFEDILKEGVDKIIEKIQGVVGESINIEAKLDELVKHYVEIEFKEKVIPAISEAIHEEVGKKYNEIEEKYKEDRSDLIHRVKTIEQDMEDIGDPNNISDLVLRLDNLSNALQQIVSSFQNINVQ